uniref:Sugar phosphate transporter domain-containing protein n=1 Tax=Cryptomonas curvata TaxID=233186 RepID=A0A7S0QIA3_9CRYP|mmetsp:Transcript_2652/g.5639  ORF Transcript_2652/g.5639 Transcript_2652/m.5639 type:complete len:403 (+) Transcript_2652:38-1246(+)|eukprot:CAMPEP_0172174456 /NCGR_PEP_ID=MMETSP1050-20130122/13675_1 /TAXON_ID=233186 /ORGANISM="Cryptomonas curvata, Strain CCAP979/52" /LENGTH=402 /DNA_ID=CAMNT_0012846435 /DNA_START=36 /DNA_END=1244 /DNA_ORIENTATION=+
MSKPVLLGALALSLAAPAAAFHGAALPSALRIRTSAASMAARPLRAMGGFAGARMLSDDVSMVAPRMLPAVRSAGTVPMKASSESAAPSKGFNVDFQLLIFFALWYLGNYYYNITNKLALNAAGGAAGFPLTIATLQLGVGCIYALFLWAAPDARRFPKVTTEDMIKMIPVAFCSAAAHSFSVFALSAGAVSFGQIVKSAEPAFAALLGVTLYNKKVSLGKWLCLIPVIGGVILASVKELDFAWSALITACLANLFAAFKGNENAKLMSTPGIKDRLENVGNQFAFTTILSFLISVPVMLLKEGSRWPEFVALWKTSPAVSFNLLASGLWFYGYNELATMTIKKTSAVTQSVANTAKRVIVIVGVAIVLKESLDPIKLLGCAIGIGGVFLYSVIDNIFPPKK